MFNYRYSWLPRHHITEVYITQVLYGIAVGLIAVFVPIYLLDLGYALPQALMFIIISKVFAVITSPVAAWLTYRIGFKHTILIRIPFFLASYLTLYALSYSSLHYFVPAAITGVSVTLYWIPVHMIFKHYSHAESRGKEVSKFESFPQMFRIAAPALGGIIAASLGFPVLILIALGLVCISTVPLFVSEDIKSTREFKWMDLFDLGAHRFIFATMADGFANMAALVLFPILIYTTLESTETLGYITSLGSIIYALSTLNIGRIIDKGERREWLRLGAILFGMTIIIRPFFSTAAGFAGVIILGALANSIYRTCLNTTMYEAANRLGDKGDEFIVVREIFLNLGRMSALFIAIIFTAWSPDGWKIGFFFGALALALMAGLLKHHRVVD